MKTIWDNERENAQSAYRDKKAVGELAKNNATGCLKECDNENRLRSLHEYRCLNINVLMYYVYVIPKRRESILLDF